MAQIKLHKDIQVDPKSGDLICVACGSDRVTTRGGNEIVCLRCVGQHAAPAPQSQMWAQSAASLLNSRQAPAIEGELVYTSLLTLANRMGVEEAGNLWGRRPKVAIRLDRDGKRVQVVCGQGEVRVLELPDRK